MGPGESRGPFYMGGNLQRNGSIECSRGGGSGMKQEGNVRIEIVDPNRPVAVERLLRQIAAQKLGKS